MHFEFVTDTFPPDINGAARTLGHLTNSLRDLGHKVSVHRSGNAASDIETDTWSFPVYKYPEIKIGVTRKINLIDRWAFDRPDVIYIATEGPQGNAAMRAAKELGIPTISGYHTNFHQYTKSFHIGFLSKLVLRYVRSFHRMATLTMVPSETCLADLQELKFRHLHIMGRGVDTNRFHPKHRCATLRNSWGASDTVPVVTFVSRISLEKNLTLLQNSIEEVLKVHPEAKVVIIGDGPAKAQFQQDHQEYIFTGFLTGEELGRHYASADMLIFPSLTETFGNVITEALASGLVVVAYDYAGASMHINNAVNGFTADVGDENAFLEATKLAATQVFDATLRENAYKSVANISWRSIAKNFADKSATLKDLHTH